MSMSAEVVARKQRLGMPSSEWLGFGWRKIRQPKDIPIVDSQQEAETVPVVYVPVINKATETADKIRTIKTIIRDHFDMTEAELVGDRRTVRHVFPRHVAIFLASRFTKLSLPGIARHFNDRDHTTILSAICSMREKRYINREVDGVLTYFEDIIKGHFNVVD